MKGKKKTESLAWLIESIEKLEAQISTKSSILMNGRPGTAMIQVCRDLNNMKAKHQAQKQQLERLMNNRHDRTGIEPVHIPIQFTH